MRIAFVGKWGAGKTTLSSLFSLYSASRISTIAIDADINCHLVSRLSQNLPKALSSRDSVDRIKQYLIGSNNRIVSETAFRKTTPPATGSRIIAFPQIPQDLSDLSMVISPTLQTLLVGTYTEEDIGASCYHNSLVILENILTHSTDYNACTVVDMVAGVDAFAGSLHAQFDMLLLVVSPTHRSVEVYDQYMSLARSAGIAHHVFVVGNSVLNNDDEAFIRSKIAPDQYIWSLYSDPYLRKLDQERNLALDITKILPENAHVLSNIFSQLTSITRDPDSRLPRLYELHKKYVAQAFIIKQFGDLASQIDHHFTYSWV